MLVLVFALGLLSQALATSDVALLIEKTFPRDNAVCYVNGKRLEVAIRGSNKYTEPREAGFGEHVFYRLKAEKKDYAVFPFGKEHTDTYSLFKGQDPLSLCTRAQGFLVGKNKFALLFSKENFPYPGKLVIQLFDAKTLSLLEAIDTEHLSDKVISIRGGLAYNSHPERNNLQMGKVSLEGAEYTFQDRPFPVWYEFDAKGRRISPSVTFKKFPLKRFYKDLKDFQKTADWNEKAGRFENDLIYVAVNHALKRECLLMTKERLNPDGKELWRCSQLERAP